MNPVIDVRGLRYRYPDGTLALNGIDFCLHAGECVALLGANGSGKTTFSLHLNGLLFGEGSVQVCGIRLDSSMRASDLASVRSKVGLVFQDADEQLFLSSVLEDVSFGPLNLGLSEEEARGRALDTLDQVGASALADKAPYHLSSGEKRRVAIAGVLAMRPEVLVLDEPTTSLDPPGQRDLMHLLRNLPQAKLIATHDMDFARALASRAVFFDKGQIVGTGTVPEIAERFRWSKD